MNTGTTEEIRKALEQITAGEWWHFQTNDSIVCDATEPIHMRKAIADILSCNHADTKLIANAPSWLRSMLEENERNQKGRDYWKSMYDTAIGIKDEVDQELKQMRENANAREQKVDTLAAELEQVKKERNEIDAELDKTTVFSRELLEEIKRLRSQLAAKDKVLESIKNAPAYTTRTWMREQASSILSQYAINESKPDTARADSVGTKERRRT